MVRSRVVDDEARTIASTRYGYDVLGRRTLVQDNNATTLRTLYDGLGFDVVKESPVYASGGFVDTYNTGIQYSPAGRATGERYRYLDDGQGTSEKYQYIEDNAYQTVSSRYSGERTMLYAHGSPVAINRSSGTRGYLGTDILGSTRSVTDNHGVQEFYYDYDIFGSPITGNYTTGADYGYLGKPYDSITGLYNYGYRDYSPQTVRFTTVDPIRDGANWFTYVNNDPVNYVDLWGLQGEPEKKFITRQPESSKIETVYHTLVSSQNKKESFFNQDKKTKMLWVEAAFVDKKGENSADMAIGLLSLSSELNDRNNTPIVAQGEVDILNANFNFSATDGGISAGLSANAVSIGGKIGVKFNLAGYEFQVIFGGSVGVTAGIEGKFDISSGMVFDFGAIVKPRIEVNWKKKKGK
ncbi:MAG: RHS repeat-associated core domain-containing protein, partial [Candidatus Treponema excrementipullorum]|nr:RHS repeat-associated core domain-containing protein [Candidatus Treponema excrementipullorum]